MEIHKVILERNKKLFNKKTKFVVPHPRLNFKNVNYDPTVE